MSGTDANMSTSKSRPRKPTGRRYTAAASPLVKKQLDALLGPRLPPEYATAMIALGESLGELVATHLQSPTRPFALVCTPEDADSLVEGMLKTLPREKARLVCYWTDRRVHSEGDVATVIQSYVDPRLGSRVDTVVVAKTIISSGCIVRTNLETFLADVAPRKVLIAAPVMVEDAESALGSQFQASIFSKFEFLTFAHDPVPEDRGAVKPGIGGKVEERLGFAKRSARFSPRLVQSWAQTA